MVIRTMSEVSAASFSATRFQSKTSRSSLSRGSGRRYTLAVPRRTGSSTIKNYLESRGKGEVFSECRFCMRI